LITLKIIIIYIDALGIWGWFGSRFLIRQTQRRDYIWEENARRQNTEAAKGQQRTHLPFLINNSKVFFYYILYYIYKLSNCCYRRLLLKPPSVSATAVQNVDRLKSSVENPVTVMVIDLVVSVLPWTILRRLEKRARFSIDRQISPDP